VNPSQSKAFLVSFPKSGRTWLRLLIGKVLCDHLALPRDRIFDTAGLTRAAALPALEPTHDHSSILFGLKYDEMPAAGDLFRDTKVLFLARDIRDLMVSCYFQATRRLGRYSGSIAEFIRSDLYGARKAITFYNQWHAEQDKPEDFLLLRYENLHSDTLGQLERAFTFLGLVNPDRRCFEEAIEFSRFDRMKKLERQGAFGDSPLLPGNPKDPESYKARRGVVGGYHDYLALADIEYIEDLVREIGCPFQEHYDTSDGDTFNDDTFASSEGS
jgi:hypothetical protein